MIRRNTIVLAGVLGLLWGFLVLPNISGAQERVKSLTIRQFEIEEAIRNGLKYYLEPRDYVLRVKLAGEQRVAGVEHEALPGFGPVVSPTQAKGEKYWEILRMQVDLVMHKEVSPSLNTYISEIVPILSGLDYERGDEFNFVPIVPQALEPPPVAQAQAAPATIEAEKPEPEKPAVVVATLPKADEQKGEQPQETSKTQPEPVAATEPVVDGPPPGLWEAMTLVEKVLAVGLALLLLLLLFVLWKLNRMQSAEQQGLAKLLAQQQQLALPGMGAMALPSPPTDVGVGGGIPEKVFADAGISSAGGIAAREQRAHGAGHRQAACGAGRLEAGLDSGDDPRQAVDGIAHPTARGHWPGNLQEPVWPGDAARFLSGTRTTRS